MKKKLLLSAFLFANFTSFSQCLPNGITTDPANPINPQLNSKTNLYFNWTQQYFSNNTTCQSSSLAESPFFKVDNLEALRTSKDMSPQDGWELIRRDLGYSDQNTIKPDIPEHSYFILYNKYTGILRVLLKTCRGADYNGMKITLKFDPTTLYQTSLLDLASTGIRSLDQTFLQNPAAQAASIFVNDRTKWFYGDFPMTYDPCTCKYKSKINIISNLIQNSQITLQGSATGTITAITNGQGSVNGDGSLSFKDFVNAGSKFKKGYDNVDKFITQAKTDASTIPNSASIITALTSFQNGLKNSNFLKTGLAAVPWLQAASGVLDFFTGGGKTSPQTVQLSPMAVNLTLRLNGTMQTSNQYHNIIFSNPGSLDAQNDPDIYPFYNEILGVFTLIKGPKFQFWRRRDQVPNYPPWIGFWRYEFKLKEAIQYAVNPASGLQLQDAQVAFIAESNVPGSNANPPSAIGDQNEFNAIEGKDSETGNWNYRTGYTASTCLSNNYRFDFNFFDGEIPVPSKFYVKFILNFQRVGNPSAQNVLLVLKYPIEFEEVTSELPAGTFNPSACLGGMVQQATASDINTFCASGTYTTSRQMRTAQTPLNLVSESVKKSIIVYPNPAKDLIHFSGILATNRVSSVNVIDQTGKVILSTHSNSLRESKPKMSISSLKSGIYYAELNFQDHTSTTVKIIVLK